ncbi:MAG: PAS domain-containing protein [Chloroflexi bacterium]|nr:PAS domain-containing protein [Chloroflexota bacterium]
MANDKKPGKQEQSALREPDRRLAALKAEREQLLKQLQEVNEQLARCGFKVKEQADELAQERDKLRAIVNAMADEVWFVNAEGIVSPVNEAAIRGLGFEKAEEIPQPIQELLSKLEIYTPEFCPLRREEAPLLRSLKGETLTNFEVIVRLRKTGELRYRLINSAPVRNGDGKIVGAIAVTRDVTDERNRMRKGPQS